MRIDAITPLQVVLAPKPLVPGVLYISDKYQVAIHLCCCGCGEKVVTPLSPAEWQLQLEGRIATLQPSIGNAAPCRSHYWIRQNRVVWAPRMTTKQIESVQKRDHASLEAMYARGQRGGEPRSFAQRLRAAFKSVLDCLHGRG
jgi:hypothetical protein